MYCLNCNVTYLLRFVSSNPYSNQRFLWINKCFKMVHVWMTVLYLKNFMKI
jgi:hypothetical protein